MQLPYDLTIICGDDLNVAKIVLSPISRPK